jgi:hypothetical protein
MAILGTLGRDRQAIPLPHITASRDWSLRGGHFITVTDAYWPGRAAGGRYRRPLARHDPELTVVTGGFRAAFF